MSDKVGIFGKAHLLAGVSPSENSNWRDLALLAFSPADNTIYYRRKDIIYECVF
jgi:hypothetical protein